MTSCICIKKKKNWSPNQCSRKSLLVSAFDRISKILVVKSAKTTVIVTTLGILAGGIYGAATMETFFDINAFLDKGTYLRNYIENMEAHFPEDGYASKIYFVDVDYIADMDNIFKLLKDMEHLQTPEKNTISPNSVDFWFKKFINFVNKERRDEFGSNVLPENKEYNNTSFLEDLDKFLR